MKSRFKEIYTANISKMYDAWENIALEIATDKTNSWKKHPAVNGMLEHLHIDYAEVYLESILKDLTMTQVEEIAAINDRIGDADVTSIRGVRSSPSSIRYIAHAIDACKHILSKGLRDVIFIEVGGGYGGLAVVMNAVSKIFGINISKYIIYDLPGVRALQQFYTSHHTLAYPIVWKESATFGEDLENSQNNFLFSAYCISELPDNLRRVYLRNLLPKVAGAYFAWNWGSKVDLPACTIKPEVPDTAGGAGNTIVLI